MAAADTPLLVLNTPLVATRLGYPDLSGLDLLELFAFIYPARFVVPTPKGLAHALGLAEPAGDEDVPALLQQAAGALLAVCDSPRLERARRRVERAANARQIALALGGVAGAPHRPARTRRTLAVFAASRMGGIARAPTTGASHA